MSDSQGWERDLLAKISLQSLKEQRAERRLRYIFRFFVLAYIAAAFYFAYQRGQAVFAEITEPHVAVVAIDGTIASDKVNAAVVVKPLERAAENEAVKAVLLKINSPGGSPVQSGVIYDEIKRIKSEHPELPILAVVEDIAASGGYYIAAAADEIVADKASVVGSIGVRSGSFGFTGTMEMLGVERRLITSGENKALLDPFSPQNQAEVEHFRTVVGSIHEQFIDAVKAGRGERLLDDPAIFSGLVWTGEQGLELGLVDSLGSVYSLARERFDDVAVKTYEPPKSLIEQVSSQLGVALLAPLESLLGVRWL
ncbi:MAG: signal peptide peptidase SppA [Gammaproteobacteria bacterium]|nr:signal peptide peptidase SppA [Gammaproteobacteria bacterium]